MLRKTSVPSIIPTDIAKRTTVCVEVWGRHGLIGYGGAVPTNLSANEFYLWYHQLGWICRADIAGLRAHLAALKEQVNASFWITTDPAKPSLDRWAAMLGFTEAGMYDSHRKWVI